MNIFDEKLQSAGKYPLKAKKFGVLEANITYKCNLACTHCYVESSPKRTEMMPREVIDNILEVLKNNDQLTTIDITGGAPELNPDYRYLVKSAADMGKKVLARSNLAIMTEPGYEDLPEFLAENRAKIMASMPCVTEDAVDAQRGKGTYRKMIPVMKKLNELGYGKEGTGLELDIVFNSASASIAPDRNMLEKVYKEKLMEMHGITFNSLIALNNALVGRLRKRLSDDEIAAYEKDLQDKFNPAAVEGCMCQHIINVSYDGRLYDCDCAQMLKLPIDEKLSTLTDFNYDRLVGRNIHTMPVCFICTAGAGTSCLPAEENAECSASSSSASSSCCEPASVSSGSCSAAASTDASSPCSPTSTESSSCSSSSTATATAETCDDEITGLVSYGEAGEGRVKEIFDQLIKGFHKVLPVYRVRNFVRDPEWMETYHEQIMYKFTPKHLDYKTLMFVEFAADIAARWEYCIGGAYDKCLIAAGMTHDQINKTIKLVSACAAMSYLEAGFDVFAHEDDEELAFIGLVKEGEVSDEGVLQIYKEAREIFGTVPELYRVRSLVSDPEWLEVFHSSIKLYFSPDVLDKKTIHLICLGALTVLQSHHGARRHMKMALRSGATPDEISEAVRGCYVNAYVFNTSAGFGMFKYSKD